MNIKIKTQGLAKLIDKFRQTPERIESSLRIEIKESLQDIQEYARSHHKFTSRSHDTEKNIQTQSTGLSGIVWLNSNVGVYQHEGTGIYGYKKKPIEIVYKRKNSLRRTNGLGFAFAKKVQIKGIKPDPFLHNAAKEKEPEIISRFDKAIEKILGE